MNHIIAGSQNNPSSYQNEGGGGKSKILPYHPVNEEYNQVLPSP